MATYQITITTGSMQGAGTDADIYVELFGTGGSTGEIVLDNRGNNFERGATDGFTVQARDVGDLQRLAIRHNNNGLAPGWFLERVSVRDDMGRTTNFYCNQWLAKSEGDGRIARELMADRAAAPGTGAAPAAP